MSQDTSHVYDQDLQGCRQCGPFPSPHGPCRSIPLLHHVLAEVLNASGMGEVVDRYLRDVEELKCLAEDGSTHSAFVSVGLSVKALFR